MKKWFKLEKERWTLFFNCFSFEFLHLWKEIMKLNEWLQSFIGSCVTLTCDVIFKRSSLKIRPKIVNCLSCNLTAILNLLHHKKIMIQLVEFVILRFPVKFATHFVFLSLSSREQWTEAATVWQSHKLQFFPSHVSISSFHLQISMDKKKYNKFREATHTFCHILVFNSGTKGWWTLLCKKRKLGKILEDFRQNIIHRSLSLPLSSWLPTVRHHYVIIHLISFHFLDNSLSHNLSFFKKKTSKRDGERAKVLY